MPQDEYVNRLYGRQQETNTNTNGHVNGSQQARAKRNGSLPEDYPAVYDQAKKLFWDKNSRGEWMAYGEAQFQRKLSFIGVQKEATKADGMNGMQYAMTEIMEEKSVHFAGELAGYPVGSYDILGNRILITRGPSIPRPQNVPFPTITCLLDSLLGAERRYFDAWIKSALNAMKAGSPFRPGQVLGIAGPAGCGKSLLQDLITEILGGRSGKPYRYLIGATTFNSDLFRAEHLVIEDEPASLDGRSRRHFAGALKGLCANRVQSFHPKGKDSMPLTPFWRVSISVNDDQDHLMVLPPLDESLMDKIILLRASQAVFPYDADDLDGRKAYREQLSAELPGYLFWLRAWKMPAAMRDKRNGCIAYQNPDLKRMLEDLEPEHKLWVLIQALGVIPKGFEGWTGTSGKLELLLREKDRSGDVARTLYYNTACGVLLDRLNKLYPENVIKKSVGHRQHVYQIIVPDDDTF